MALEVNYNNEMLCPVNVWDIERARAKPCDSVLDFEVTYRAVMKRKTGEGLHFLVPASASMMGDRSSWRVTCRDGHVLAVSANKTGLAVPLDVDRLEELTDGGPYE